MGRTACTHNHHTTNLATRLLNTIEPSTATLNLRVLSTGPLQWDNLITDSHNMANPNIVNPSMDKHLTGSFSPVPTPCLEDNPPQTPGTIHKLGWPPWEGHYLCPS